MEVRIKADMGPLKRFQDQLKRASISTLQELSLALGEECIELVKEGFSRQADPSDSPWAPLKRRVGRILQDTGALRNGWHVVSATASEVTIAPNVTYAEYRQTGTRRMPARKMIPEGELPPRWSRALEEVAEEILGEAFE